MVKRPAIETKIEDIVQYWFTRIDESELSVDRAEASTHCWRCGTRKNLERCHIVPYALGGIDAPENLVLLCKRCHAEGPNVQDTEVMWDWIKAYRVPFYNVFWKAMGIKEYRFIYDRSLLEEVSYLFKDTDINTVNQELNRIIEQSMRKASVHFGQPYFNSATMAGILRMSLKKLAKDYNKELLPKKKKEWWTEEIL